ncbi:MAG: hypothetical protein LBV27_04800 [Oscillospiraceae bacterium]|jgi:hypothetical protein|nr:hypothetical protein [Oscillospiraceae bacterium]
MATTIIIVAMFAVLLPTHFYAALRGGEKKLAWFYTVSLIISFSVLVLHSLGVKLVGPSQIVMDIARALSLA